MDSFPLKKGIGLSHNPQSQSQPQGLQHFHSYTRQLVKQHQQVTRNPQPQLPATNRLPHFYVETKERTNSTHSRINSGNVYQNMNENSPNKGVMTKGNDSNTLTFTTFTPSTRNEEPLAFQPAKQELKLQRRVEQISTSSKDVSQIQNISTSQYDQLIPMKFIKNQLPLKQINQKDSNIDFYFQRLAAQQAQFNERIKIIEKQKEEFQQKVSETESKKRALWEQQRSQLFQQIAQKERFRKQEEEKTRQIQQAYKTKIYQLENDLRQLKGNKTRLEMEIDSNKKIMKHEREKNQKAKQQMNKLIFFEQDLIHAKEYNRLKEEVESLQLENSKLSDQHQAFILEVGQYRKTMQPHVIELRIKLDKAQSDFGEYQMKIDRFINNGEDKMTIIKLQNQINFLKKKQEEQNQQLIQREGQLEQAMRNLQELSSQQISRNPYDDINVKQIQESITTYEVRLAELNDNLNKKVVEADKQKKMVELLTTQLRRARQEKQITSMKGKSSEENLKSQVEILQKGFQTQIELRNKKISNLQEFIVRKTKEISDKDKFIKDFLISRIKQFADSSPDDFMMKMRQFFQEEACKAK